MAQPYQFAEAQARRGKVATLGKERKNQKEEENAEQNRKGRIL